MLKELFLGACHEKKKLKLLFNSFFKVFSSEKTLIII